MWKDVVLTVLGDALGALEVGAGGAISIVAGEGDSPVTITIVLPSIGRVVLEVTR